MFQIINCAKIHRWILGWKIKMWKLVSFCLRNLTELTEAGRAPNGLKVSNTPICQAPVVTLATCQSVELKWSFIQANVKWKQQKSLKCCLFPSSNMKKCPALLIAATTASTPICLASARLSLLIFIYSSCSFFFLFFPPEQQLARVACLFYHS